MAVARVTMGAPKQPELPAHLPVRRRRHPSIPTRGVCCGRHSLPSCNCLAFEFIPKGHAKSHPPRAVAIALLLLLVVDIIQAIVSSMSIEEPLAVVDGYQ
ncbi:hypothetical protein EJB05_15566, partial [Eragrostis curvula]